jgi:hypothetical protein
MRLVVPKGWVVTRFFGEILVLKLLDTRVFGTQAEAMKEGHKQARVERTSLVVKDAKSGKLRRVVDHF